MELYQSNSAGGRMNPGAGPSYCGMFMRYKPILIDLLSKRDLDSSARPVLLDVLNSMKESDRNPQIAAQRILELINAANRAMATSRSPYRYAPTTARLTSGSLRMIVSVLNETTVSDVFQVSVDFR